MRPSAFIPLSLGLGLMLCPESLIIHLNGIGSLGAWYIAASLAGAALMSTLAHVYNLALGARPWPAGEAQVIRDVAGMMAAAVFPLAARVAFCVVATSVLVVTAGFTFNEVFLYWFPNFAFAYLLLSGILAVNLISRKLAGRLQALLVVIAFSCLLIVTAYGLFSAPASPVPTPPVTDGGLFLPFMAKLTLAYMGLEIAGFAYREGQGSRLPVAAPFVICALFILAGMAAGRHFDLRMLTESTVPYMIYGREIMGQPGRLIMGMAVLCGVAAAVNALIYSTSMTLSRMKADGYVLWLSSSDRINAGALALGSAVIMALGLAGEPRLMDYMFAAMLLWLLNYALVSACFAIRQRHTVAALVGAVLLAAVGIMLMRYAEPLVAGKMAGFTLLGFAVPAVIKRLAVKTN